MKTIATLLLQLIEEIKPITEVIIGIGKDVIRVSINLLNKVIE